MIKNYLLKNNKTVILTTNLKEIILEADYFLMLGDNYKFDF